MIDIEGSVAEIREIWAMGPGMHKRPNDLVRYETILGGLQPAVVVETGLYYGGSHHWFAERVPMVISVEIDLAMIAAFRENAWGLGKPSENGIVIPGDSVGGSTPEVVHALARKWADDGPILVVLDSDHSAPHVYAEMRAYGGLVTPGSYMVVEDGILGYMPPGGFKKGNWYDGSPRDAIESYLRDETFYRFVNDDTLEDMLPTTQHPGGWLQRR